jgi:hypothetical protein
MGMQHKSCDSIPVPFGRETPAGSVQPTTRGILYQGTARPSYSIRGCYEDQSFRPIPIREVGIEKRRIFRHFGG